MVQFQVNSQSKRLLWIAVTAIAAVWIVVVEVIVVDRLKPRPLGIFEASPSNPSGDGPLPVLWKSPSFSALDQDGHVVTEKTLEHHVWIADFIFTRCTTACPLISAKLLLVRKAIASSGIRFVSFSVDSEFDTPAVLKDYSGRWSGDPRWLLLSANPSDVQDIARGMKVPLERTGDPTNPILHTTLFFLVDAGGSLRGVYDSVDEDAVNRLVKDAQRLDGVPSSRTAEPAQAGPPDAGRGAALFASVGCAGCHTDDRVAPPLGGIFGSMVHLEGGAMATVDDAFLTESILEPNARIAVGYSSIMPSYRDHLSEAQVADLVAYVHAMPSAARPAIPATDPATPAPAIDPVCGMQVHVADESPQTRYKDKTYYFCSDLCRDRFSKAPEKFVPGG